MLKPLVCVCVLVVTIGIAVTSNDGYFNGGSLSYNLVDNPTTGHFDIQLDVITGWKLGHGPCGPGCSKSDVGKSTMPHRRSVSPLAFGKWSAQNKVIGVHEEATVDLNNIIMTNMEASVLAVSEVAEWEQEWMRTTIPLEHNLEFKDIAFEGMSWRNLSLQGFDHPWYIQAKVMPQSRSDTGRPNNSPKVMLKPYYRVQLGKVSSIKINAIDADGDMIKCFNALYVESGSLKQADGITYEEEECVVNIDASVAKGYYDNFWLVLTAVVKDYNRKVITIGSKQVRIAENPLSRTTDQFLLNVIADLKTPTFVDPTLPSNHEFILLLGAKWTTEIYAEAVVNTTIDEFIVYGRYGELLTSPSPKHDDPTRAQVKYTKVSWKPLVSDIGHHLICVRVVDNTGVDSDEDRCFSISVKENTFSNSAPSATIPYFIDFPDLNEILSCDIGSTCVLPLFVNSKITQVKEVVITQTFLVEARIGEKLIFGMHGSGFAYSTELSFRQFTDGVFKLCMEAIDKKCRKSDEMCIHVEINPKDPCLKNPCRNSAVCTPNPTYKTDYLCACLSDYFFGKKCENQKDLCDPNPCLRGQCAVIYPTYYCRCPSGYTGKSCDQNTNDCHPNSCNGHGICKDGVDNFTCACYGRYTGTNCEKDDSCPTETADTIVCPGAIPSCTPDPCSGHGVCSSGGKCTCRLDYLTAQKNCSQAIGRRYTNPHGVSIKSPTLPDGSVITCYTPNDPLIPCTLAVYMKPKGSSPPTVNVSHASADLLPHSFAGPVSSNKPVTSTSFMSGIGVMYMSTITFKGTNETKGRKYACITAKDSLREDRRCIEIIFIQSPMLDTNSREFLQKNANTKFISPTPVGESHFLCNQLRRCSLVLYTHSSTGSCHDVITSDGEVTVFPSTKISSGSTGTCIHEIAYSFALEGTKHICFQSSVVDFQIRCYYVDVTPRTGAPCLHNPCENDGLCIPTTTGYKCICGPKNYGLNCENGECSPVNNTCARGYCSALNGSTSCVCSIGYNGDTCNEEIPANNPNADQNGSKFSDTGIPISVVCIKNRPCSVPFGLSGKYQPGHSPVVKPGYTSPGVAVGAIQTVADTQPVGSYTGSVQFTAKQSGQQVVCLQTVNKDGNFTDVPTEVSLSIPVMLPFNVGIKSIHIYSVNKDEMCFKLDVKSETSSVYGFLDRPHFTTPSLPARSQIKCAVDEPCHVMYFVTPGSGHEGKCLDIKVTKSAFTTIKVFSSCDNCHPGDTSNNNCTLDVAFTPTMADLNVVGDKNVCLLLSLTSPPLRGEERCFKVSVINTADYNNAPGGCKDVHCENGGFCDSHITPTVCYCQHGNSGQNCEIAKPQTSTHPSADTTFKGDSAVLKEVTCSLNNKCEIPFQLFGKSSLSSTVISGDVDPTITVDKVQTTPSSNSGTMLIQPTATGPHDVCIKAMDGSLVNDVLCITVNTQVNPMTKSDQTKPYMIYPTPPAGSTLLCSPQQQCHLYIHFAKGDKIGSTSCPTLAETSSTPLEGVHIFPTSISTSDCNADVSYIPASTTLGTTQKICLQVALPGKKGEERCFRIKIVANISTEVTDSCGSCLNGGKCIADVSPGSQIEHCVCTHGYSGDKCSKAANVPRAILPGVTGAPALTPITPSFDGFSSIPKDINCKINTPCAIPVVFYGSSNKPPKVGYVDNGMSASKPEVLPHVPTQLTHIVMTHVTATKTGSHQMCLQTTVDGSETGVNIDEICINVTVSNTGSLQSKDPNKPRFDDNTMMPDGSTMTCDTNIVCHIPIVTEPTAGNICPSVQQCAGGIPFVHVFTPVLTNGKCIADIAMKTGSVDLKQQLCVSAGISGEERHYPIQTDKYSGKDFGPCQKLHCQNGGLCDHLNDKRCLCKAGFNGDTCDKACTKPPDHGTHSTYVSINGTYGGSTATYRCNRCFTIVNDILLRSACFNGVWTPAPVCTLMDCHPPSGNHTTCTTTHGTLYGSAATCTCNQGYEGPLSIHCRDTGNWDPSPTCTIIDCGSPNGTGVICTGSSATTYGTYVTCSCKTGYQGSGLTTMTCRDTGNWDPLPTCTVIDCLIPSPLDHSTCSTTSGTTYGSTAICTCHPGYQSSDSMSIECRETGVWDIAPTCTDPCGCSNGGLCNVINNLCICPVGYSGPNCAKVGGVVLSGLSSLTSGQAPPQFSEHTIPERIQCVTGQPCTVVLPIQATTSAGQVPNVVNGHHTPDLQTNVPVTTLRPGSSCLPDGSPCDYETTITLKPQSTGDSKYCAQTSDDNNINADELCFTIHTSGSKTTAPPSKFNSAVNFPNGSVMACAVDLTCHFPVEVDKDGLTCKNLLANPSLDHVLITSSTPSSTTKCRYDVAFMPDASQKGSHELCFKQPSVTMVPSINDDYCINVDVKTNAELLSSLSPCRRMHCQNKGFCQNINNTATCLCRMGYAGQTCKSNIKPTLTLPDTVKCEQSTVCSLTFPIVGNNGINPVVVSNSSEAGTPTFVTDSNNPGLFHTSIPITTTSDNSTICFNISTYQGSNDTEEHCVTVVKVPPSFTPAGPGHFTSSKQSFKCEPDTSCNIFLHTSPRADGTCPSVGLDKGTNLENVHVFPEPTKTLGECTTPMVVTPSPTEEGKHQVCLRSDTDRRCIVINVHDDQETCDVKEAMTTARKNVAAGFASCYCMVNGKKVYIIKKRPVVPTQRLLAVGGYGAAGMTVAMGVVMGIYTIATRKNKVEQALKTKQSCHQRQPTAKTNPNASKNAKRGLNF